jgi:hypothetical protein
MLPHIHNITWHAAENITANTIEAIFPCLLSLRVWKMTTVTITGTDTNHSIAISWEHQKFSSDNPCLLNLHRLMAKPTSPESREWLGDSASKLNIN